MSLVAGDDQDAVARVPEAAAVLVGRVDDGTRLAGQLISHGTLQHSIVIGTGRGLGPQVEERMGTGGTFPHPTSP